MDFLERNNKSRDKYNIIFMSKRDVSNWTKCPKMNDVNFKERGIIVERLKRILAIFIALALLMTHTVTIFSNIVKAADEDIDYYEEEYDEEDEDDIDDEEDYDEDEEDDDEDDEDSDEDDEDSEDTEEEETIEEITELGFSNLTTKLSVGTKPKITGILEDDDACRLEYIGWECSDGKFLYGSQGSGSWYNEIHGNKGKDLISTIDGGKTYYLRAYVYISDMDHYKFSEDLEVYVDGKISNAKVELDGTTMFGKDYDNISAYITFAKVTTPKITKPKNTTGLKLTAKSKGFKASWKKYTKDTNGYQIQYSTNKNFKSNNKTVTISNNKTTSTTVNKLKAKKKYYVRIRTYKTVGKTKYYSSWSGSKNVTTKK